VNAITRSLAQELGPRKIRINPVAPGVTETEGLRATNVAGSTVQRRQPFATQTPRGRIGQPNDIAPAVVFLASAESAGITGEILYASGGLR